MTITQSLLLGLIQGLAEFLPISSSGHLAILQNLFGIEGDQILALTATLHFGTLISLVAVYYKDLWDLIKELFATLKDLFTGKGLRPDANETRKLGIMIVIATIPTAAFGLLLNDFFDAMYTSMILVGVNLLVTGTLLWTVERITGKGRTVREMKYRHALLVGLFQTIAMMPGISRSGSTIAGGLISGLKREFAVRFAFLVSVPPILGAVILEMPDALASGGGDMVLPIIAGVVTAAVSGFLAIKFMIRLVTNKGLKIFSYYTWVAGAVLIVYTLLS